MVSLLTSQFITQRPQSMTFLSWPPLSPRFFRRFQIHFIDNLKSDISDELRSAQSSKFQPLCLGMFYTHIFPSIDFDTRIELRISSGCDGISGGAGTEREEVKCRWIQQQIPRLCKAINTIFESDSRGQINYHTFICSQMFLEIFDNKQR